MATRSLGRLTLDLAVRLSEFVDGMSKAERETVDRTKKMSDAVDSFKSNLMDQLGGTQIGGVIDNLNGKLGGLKGGAGMAAAGLAGLAIGGAAVAIGSLSRLAIDTAKADAQLAILANRANTSVQNFQTLSVAAQGLGISTDQLGSMLADVQEKLGEFSATAGGEAKDFFEALKNNTKMTDEQIKQFGKTLQGKDGVEALQMIKDKLDELGASAQEQRFILESLGNDVGNLGVIFADGGAILNQYRDALEEAGVLKTQEAIEQSQLLAAQTQAVQQRYEGFKSQLASQMIPTLSTLANYFLSGGDKASAFGAIIKGVGYVAKGVAVALILTGGAIAQFGATVGQVINQIGNVGRMGYNFLMADGLEAKMAAISQGLNSMGSDFSNFVSSSLERSKNMAESLDSLINGKLSASNDELVQANLALSKAQNQHTQGLRVDTEAAKENEKANKAAAKARADGAKNDKKTDIVGGNANQNMVYKAWLSAGLSDNQARIITAEVGRENDYQSRYLWGGHNDPANGKYNLGMISWQQDRGENLYKYLNARGFIKNGQIVKSQEALNAQAAFAVNEMRTNSRYQRTRDTFLANPDISYQKGVEVLGNNYIKWRYTDPKYASHHRRRDRHYDNLNRTLSNNPNAVGKGGDNTQAVKIQEDTERTKQAVTQRYAKQAEKDALEHQKNLNEINLSFAEGSIEHQKYTALEKARYEELVQEREIERKLRYAEGEERITLEHQKKVLQIKRDFAEDDPSYQIMLDKATAAYEEDLKKFRWAAGEKVRAQQEMIKKLSDDMAASSRNSTQETIDILNRGSMRPEDYQLWRIDNDYANQKHDAEAAKSRRINEINAVDGSTGDFLLDAEQRNALIEQAEQEHVDRMALIHATYHANLRDAEKQIAEQRVQTVTQSFAAQTEAMKTFFGEQSGLYRAAAIMERSYAVYQAIMNAEETRSNVYTAVAAIPHIGPYLAGPMSVAAVAIQVANAARIGNMPIPSFSGVAHGGMDYVPKETTFLLDKGERVLSPRQNRDLTNYLNQRQSSGEPGGNNISISVSVDNSGGGDVQSDALFGKKMGEAIRQAVYQVLVQEKKQGGLIAH